MKTRDDVKTMQPNRLVSWFMMASYAYYKIGERVMSDPTFDFLVERLKEVWEKADHPHKALIKPGNLDSYTGFDIEYPTIIHYATRDYIHESR